jgi:hypothetical protein
MVKHGLLSSNKMKKMKYLMIFLLFIYSCSNEIQLTYEMKGTFVGYEPTSLMKVGNKQIEIPGSKWRVEISDDKLSMIQVSDGQTISYYGGFNVKDNTEVSLTIIGSLTDDKYDQKFTPTIIFNKNNAKWFLKGVAGSEGCVLDKQ